MKHRCSANRPRPWREWVCSQLQGHSVPFFGRSSVYGRARRTRATSMSVATDVPTHPSHALLSQQGPNGASMRSHAQSYQW